jgi:adenosylcobinamide-phosphate synthase
MSMAMTGAISLLAAFGLDAAFGEPPNALHPVAWIGGAIARGRDWALSGGRAYQFAKGALVAAAVPGASAAVAYELVRALAAHPVLVLVVTALALKPMFAIRALGEAAFRVRDALDAGDLVAARRALASLCSRDARDLDAEGLIAATIESVAENTSDSVVAPLLHFAAFGLPGAVFYRAANTVDAMMGYHGKLEWAGKVGARLDDLLNLLPARVTALLLIVAGALQGSDARRGISTWRRDARLTASPNAGHPMAAMAGLLGVRLEKRGCYALGDTIRPLRVHDIAHAWRIALLASVLATVVAACAIALAPSGGIHG